MSGPNGEHCLGCGWLDDEDIGRLKCRRFPPSGAIDRLPHSPGFISDWPHVFPSDWCGEFSHTYVVTVTERKRRLA